MFLHESIHSLPVDGTNGVYPVQLPGNLSIPATITYFLLYRLNPGYQYFIGRRIIQ